MLVFEGCKIRREATDATLSIGSTCTQLQIRGPLLPLYSPFVKNIMRVTNGVLQLATPQCALEISSTVATAQALHPSDVNTVYEGQDQLQNRAEIVGFSEYNSTHVPST